jgi:hypothetical protein
MRSASSSSFSLSGRMETLALASSIIGFLLPPALFGRVLANLHLKA